MPDRKKTYVWLKAHSDSKEKVYVISPFCVNEHGTLTKDQLAAQLTMAGTVATHFQGYTEDNTSNYNLSLISLLENQTLKDIETKTLIDAEKTGTPILVKTIENVCFIYGNQNGEWDFVPVEAKDIDLNQLPFDKKLLRRQDSLFDEPLKDLLQKAHVPYYQRWLKENENLLANYPINDIHTLRENPFWKRFKAAYLEYRDKPENKTNVLNKLKKDRKNVLSSHPEWIDTIDEHLMNTAIDWAVLQMSEGPKEPNAVTYIWYPHDATKTAMDALQFARENAEKLGFTMKNVVHFEFDIDDLVTEYTKIIKQEKIAMPAQQTKEPEYTETLPVLGDSLAVLHPDAKDVLSIALLRAMQGGQLEQAAAFLFYVSDECHVKSRRNSPPRTSNVVINGGLQLRQEEMKTYSPPPSPKGSVQVNFMGSPKTSLQAVGFHSRQKSCGSEEPNTLLTSVTHKPPTLRVGNGE